MTTHHRIVVVTTFVVLLLTFGLTTAFAAPEAQTICADATTGALVQSCLAESP